jgi:hypothetical protein
MLEDFGCEDTYGYANVNGFCMHVIRNMKF